MVSSLQLETLYATVSGSAVLWNNSAWCSSLPGWEACCEWLNHDVFTYIYDAGWEHHTTWRIFFLGFRPSVPMLEYSATSFVTLLSSWRHRESFTVPGDLQITCSYHALGLPGAWMMRWTLGAGMPRPTWMIHWKSIAADDVCAGTGADDDAYSIISGFLHSPPTVLGAPGQEAGGSCTASDLVMFSWQVYMLE